MMTDSTTVYQHAQLRHSLPYEHNADEILHRRQGRSAALTQPVSPGKDIAVADGETGTGKACSGTVQVFALERIKPYLVASITH